MDLQFSQPMNHRQHLLFRDLWHLALLHSDDLIPSLLTPADWLLLNQSQQRTSKAENYIKAHRHKDL